VQAPEQADQRAFAFADQQLLHRDLFEEPIRAGGERRSRSTDAHPIGEASCPDDPVQLIGGARQR
jgi:hypothetical protein